MEVFLTDAATGVTHAVDIGMDEKPDRLKLEAGEAFRYPDGVEEEDVHLSVGGKAVCDDEPLCSHAGVEAGCVVHVTLCPDRHLDAVHKGVKELWQVPLWVTTRDEVLQAVRELTDEDDEDEADWFEHAHTTVKGDREIVLAAVQQHGSSLEFADDSLKGDREIVLAAFQQDGDSLKNADDSLKGDRDIVLAAVQQHGHSLQYADDSLKGDREIVLAAVQQHWYSLKYADDSLKGDREIVLAAVQQHGHSLQYADDSLKGDREIVLAAVQHGYSLEDADDSLKGDREIVLAAVQQHAPSLEFADDSLKGDREIVLAAVQQDGYSLEDADDSLKGDREIVLAAVQGPGRSSKPEEAAPHADDETRAAASTLAALGSPDGDAESSVCSGKGEDHLARKATASPEPSGSMHRTGAQAGDNGGSCDAGRADAQQPAGADAEDGDHRAVAWRVSRGDAYNNGEHHNNNNDSDHDNNYIGGDEDAGRADAQRLADATENGVHHEARGESDPHEPQGCLRGSSAAEGGVHRARGAATPLETCGSGYGRDSERGAQGAEFYKGGADAGRADAQQPADAAGEGVRHEARGGVASLEHRGEGDATAQRACQAASAGDWGVGGATVEEIRLFFTCADVQGKWGSAATAVSGDGNVLWNVERRAECGNERAAAVRALLAGLQELVGRGGAEKRLYMWTDVCDAVDAMRSGVRDEPATRQLVSEAKGALKAWEEARKGRQAQYGMTETTSGVMATTFERAKEVLTKPPAEVSAAVATERTLAGLLSPFMKGTVECGGGGDCLFKALSHALIGKTDLHGDLRKAAADRLRAAPADYAEFVDGGELAEYANAVEVQGTWVGHVAAKAVADSMGTAIRVYDVGPEGQLRHTEIAPCVMEHDGEAATAAGGEFLELGYVDGMHYVAVVTTEGCETEKPPGQSSAPNLRARIPQIPKKKAPQTGKGKKQGWKEVPTKVKVKTPPQDRSTDTLVMQGFAQGTQTAQEGILRAGCGRVNPQTVALWTGSTVDALLLLRRHPGLTLLTSAPVAGATSVKTEVYVETREGVVKTKKWASSTGPPTVPVAVDAKPIPMIVFAETRDTETPEQAVERVQNEHLNGDSLISIREVNRGVEGLIHMPHEAVAPALQASGKGGIHIRVLAERQEDYPVSCLWEDAWGMSVEEMQAAVEGAGITTLGWGKRHSGGTSLRVHTNDMPATLAALKERCPTRLFELQGVLPRFQKGAIETGLHGLGWTGAVAVRQIRVWDESSTWSVTAQTLPPGGWMMQLLGRQAWVREVTGHPPRSDPYPAHGGGGRGGGAKKGSQNVPPPAPKTIYVRAKQFMKVGTGARLWADVAGGTGKSGDKTPRQQQQQQQSPGPASASAPGPPTAAAAAATAAAAAAAPD